MAIQVNPLVNPRIITIPEADGDSITIQSLVNQIRAWEGNQANLAYPKLLSAAGKEDLGGDVFVGITAKLENTKVKFEARSSPTVCTIYGGNLVAVDVNNVTMSPIEPSTNVNIALAQSSSATLVAEWTESEKEGLPARIWVESSTRKLTSRDIESDAPGEHIPSEEQVLSLSERVQNLLGTGFSSDKESLVKIRELIEGLSTAGRKGGFRV